MIWPKKKEQQQYAPSSPLRRISQNIISNAISPLRRIKTTLDPITSMTILVPRLQEGSESSTGEDRFLSNKASGDTYNIQELLEKFEEYSHLASHATDVDDKRQHVEQIWKLLHCYGWDGSVVMIQGKPFHLLQECLQNHMYETARFLIKYAHVDMEQASQALLDLAAQPDALCYREKFTLILLLLSDTDAHPEYQDDKGRTALQLAYENKARFGFLATLAGVTNTDQRYKGNTLLHQAVQDNQERVVRMLLQHGHANPNLIDRHGHLPLVTAAHLPTDACLQVLLRHEANVNMVNADGRTALRLVENPAASRLLLQQGARSDVADKDGVTPLHTAFGLWCRWRRGQNLAVLLFPSSSSRSHDEATTTNNDGTENNNSNNHHDNVKHTGLLDLLVQQASDINVRDHHGCTVLHYACQVGHAPAPLYVQGLVERGADLTARDDNGWTALHVAMAFGNYDTATTLVDLGAPLDTRDTLGRTALHVMGLHRLAAIRLPRQEVSHAIRILAFGPEAPPPPSSTVPPPPHYHQDNAFKNDKDDDDLSDQQRATQHFPKQEAQSEASAMVATLIDKCLHKGFDFTSMDHLQNLPFVHAPDDTLHYLMVHAAACQGLFCFTQKHHNNNDNHNGT